MALQIASVSATGTKGYWELKAGSQGAWGAFSARGWPSAQNPLLLIRAVVFLRLDLNKWDKPKWNLF